MITASSLLASLLASSLLASFLLASFLLASSTMAQTMQRQDVCGVYTNRNSVSCFVYCKDAAPVLC
jgi:hypothetical protein